MILVGRLGVNHPTLGGRSGREGAELRTAVQLGAHGREFLSHPRHSQFALTVLVCLFACLHLCAEETRYCCVCPRSSYAVLDGVEPVNVQDLGTESSITTFGSGDDAVGSPHRAQMSQFEPFELQCELLELILFFKSDKQLPVSVFA